MKKIILLLCIMLLGCAQLPAIVEVSKLEITKPEVEESLIDVDKLVEGEWGEPIWVDDRFLPHQIRVYFKNPKINGDPVYACVFVSQQGAFGYTYLCRSGVICSFKRISQTKYLKFDASPDMVLEWSKDYKIAEGKYKDKHGAQN